LSQELEILKILSDFVIFLISITIPTYAIAVSLLGPEYQKMMEKLKVAKEKLEKELHERAGALTLEEVDAKMKEFHQKENELKNRIKTLSLYPTVAKPNAFFAVALISLLTGIYLNSQPFFLYLTLSLGSMSVGLVFLASALSMIQKAAIESG
jgi:ABC-type multidrug transport system fused ATPase/permease subunit